MQSCPALIRWMAVFLAAFCGGAASVTLAQEPSPVASRDEIVNSLGMTLKLIPAGEFLMGSPAGEAERKSDEGPQHRVRISSPFYLAAREVTQAEWKQVMGSEPWQGQNLVQLGDRIAATFINWDDAQAFCRKLTELDRAAGLLAAGQEYRLPTEAEWEYACRAGSNAAFCFGDDPQGLNEYAWWGSLDGNGSARNQNYAHLVGEMKPNAWGLFDMHGNAQEWCLDGYDAAAYKARGELTVDPVNTTAARKVLRGGTWCYYSGFARSAARAAGSVGGRNDLTGFRVARSP